jgi:hypothetical protein
MQIKDVVEEKWSTLNEAYMRYMSDVCKTKAAQHEKAGYLFKDKNTFWGLPMVLVPIMMSPISILIDEESKASKYVNALAFLLTGVIGGVYSFFKYGEKMSNHFNFSARYADVASDIEMELIKGREFRTQLDVFSTRIHMLVDNLANTESVIPWHIQNDEKYKMGDFQGVLNPQEKIPLLTKNHDTHAFDTGNLHDCEKHADVADMV